MNIHQPVVARYVGPSIRTQPTWRQTTVNAKINAILWWKMLVVLFWLILLGGFGLLFVVGLIFSIVKGG